MTWVRRETPKPAKCMQRRGLDNRAVKHLWGGAQLQVLDIVCSKVLNDFLGYASEDCMVCGDLMDHSEYLEHLAQDSVTCIALRITCQGRSCSV